jgi:hypothetical protein
MGFPLRIPGNLQIRPKSFWEFLQWASRDPLKTQVKKSVDEGHHKKKTFTSVPAA